MSWLMSLFARRKLIYSTYDEAGYMKVMNELDAAGVRFILKSKRNNEFLESQWSNLGNQTEYNFYVRAEDVGRAYKAMHQG